MATSTRKPRYEAVCSICYSCTIAQSTKRMDVNRAATSHMNLYGHQVFILDRRLPKMPEPDASR